MSTHHEPPSQAFQFLESIPDPVPYSVEYGKHSEYKEINAKPGHLLIGFNFVASNPESKAYLTQCDRTSDTTWKLRFFNPGLDASQNVTINVFPFQGIIIKS